jgi:hypothetical protein
MGANLAWGIGEEVVGTQLVVGEVARVGRKGDECSVPPKCDV